MTRRTSKYPTSILICDILNNSGLKPAAFIRAIGYRNVNGGFRALDEWLQTGCGDPTFLRRLVTAYGRPDEIRDMLIKTAEVKEHEAVLAAQEKKRHERLHFRPYVFVESSLRTPSSITIAGLLGCRMKFIRLPDYCLEMRDEDQLTAVQDIVRRHYQENHGQCPLFGDITGYHFVNNYDESIRLAAHGSVISREVGHFEIPLHVGVRIGGKWITTTEAGPAIVSRF